MAEFKEYTEETGKKLKANTKKLMKNKYFLLALGIVAVLGLYSYYKKNKSGKTNDDELTVAYTSTGYDGYPTATGESLDSIYESMDNVYNSAMNEIENLRNENNALVSDITQTISDIQKEKDNEISQIISSFSAERKDYDKTISYLELQNQKQEEEAKKQATIEQMKTNANLYHYSDSAEKERLKAENERLGASLGAYKDSDGRWYVSNTSSQRLFTTTLEESGATRPNTNPKSTTDRTKISYDSKVDYQEKIETAIKNGASGSTINKLNQQRNQKIKDSGSKPAVTYDKNTDYQALINKAKAAGASQAVINTLKEKRQAKIKGENLNYK